MPLRQQKHPGSYFTWLPLPDNARADRIAATLATQRISVSTAEPFAITDHPPQAIRLVLGSTDLASLAEALTTVRATIGDDRHGYPPGLHDHPAVTSAAVVELGGRWAATTPRLARR